MRVLLAAMALAVAECTLYTSGKFFYEDVEVFNQAYHTMRVGIGEPPKSFHFFFTTMD